MMNIDTLQLVKNLVDKGFAEDEAKDIVFRCISYKERESHNYINYMSEISQLKSDFKLEIVKAKVDILKWICLSLAIAAFALTFIAIVVKVLGK